jgi:hypothetical protein
MLWNVDVRFAQKVLWQVCKLLDGSQDEERTSERIAQQQEEPEKLVKGRDAILKK